MMRWKIMAALCCLPFFSTAQEVQWACDIEDCSQTYSGGESDYKAAAAVGEPDVWFTRPRASSKCFLFGWDEKADDEVDGEVFVKVKFCTPQVVNRVAVVENANPGSITGVFLYDSKGNEHKVYTGEINNTTAPRRLLEVVVPQTAYKVASMMVVGKPGSVKGWNGLDGFAIANSTMPIALPVEVENLGPKINGKLDDLSPRISPDGKTLYMVIEGHPDNAGSSVKDDDQDVWFATQDPHGEWKAPENIGKPLNNTSYNWLINMTPDERVIYVSGKYDTSGNPDGQGVSYANKTATGFTIPKALEIANFYNENDYADYFMSNDERVLISALERKDSKGDLDLYVSLLISGHSYTEPKNMGTVINTKKTEGAPFLAADGVTLYYSGEDRPGGLGDNDIWMTKRLDDTWTNWSEPKNLGAPINSADYDSDFSISAQGDYAYLARYNDTYGGSDIFRVPLGKDVQPNPVVLIRGRVLNAKTREPLGAAILYELLPDGAEAGTAMSDGTSGEYQIILPYGKVYGFMAQTSGFYPVTENLDLTSLTEYREIEKDLLLAPVEVGETIRLNNIFFESGKATLLSESYPELKRVADLLKSNTSIKIELSGHTDNVGSDASNQALSQARAEACVAYLSSQGVADGIAVKGYGETKPVASNDTDEGRARNRRVEFKVLEK